MTVQESDTYQQQLSPSSGKLMTSPSSLITRLASSETTGRTEADIQSDIKLLLTSGDFNLDTPRLEEQIGDGTRRRIDIATGATVIEVKNASPTRPPTPTTSTNSPATSLPAWTKTAPATTGSSPTAKPGGYSNNPPPTAPSPAAAPSTYAPTPPGQL